MLNDIKNIGELNILDDMKDFCCLDLKCSAMFSFTSNFHQIYLNLYVNLFIAQPVSYGMNATENMHEVRFPNIYILSHIIYYIPPLTIIIVLGIKEVGFSKTKSDIILWFNRLKEKHNNIEMISRFKYT